MDDCWIVEWEVRSFWVEVQSYHRHRQSSRWSYDAWNDYRYVGTMVDYVAWWDENDDHLQRLAVMAALEESSQCYAT